jgi:transposase
LICEDQEREGPAHARGMRQAAERPRGYPSDLTDAQWQVIAPHLPAEVPGRRGRPRVWPLRRIVEAILYLDRAGCAWRYLPSSRRIRLIWAVAVRERSSEIQKFGCERCS